MFAEGVIVEGKALTGSGKNVFSEISTLSALVPALAGFSAMSWENPGLAGELKEDQLNAVCNSFAERATDILWTRIYQHLRVQMEKSRPFLTASQIDAEIQILVSGMDLWG
jgi:hypothetical protein